MPRTNDAEYRNRTVTVEREDEYGEKATAEKGTEYRDEKPEDDKAEYAAESRDNSYQASNQHMVKFTDELKSINEQAALDFDKRKNPAEYDLKEKQEMLEALTEAFNATNWNSANERRQAADDIAQNLYQPMYPRVEIAEAAVQHKLSDEFIKELREQNIEFLVKSKDESGNEVLELRARDIEAAERLVDKSNGMFHVASTRNLDRYRDQFADALYSSDRSENAKERMERSLDDAIRYYNGDTSHVNRWDYNTEQEPDLWEDGEDGEESDRRQAQGRNSEQVDPSYRELLAFRNLESMDEYSQDHEIADILNEKLGHTQEYLAELQANQHPDARAAAQVHEALYEMTFEGIKASVEKGDAESFTTLLRNIEGADQSLALEMRERNGFVGGETYTQPKLPENFTSLESISDYIQEVREKTNEHRDNMPELNCDLTDKLLEKLELQVQMTGEWDNPGLNAETAEDYRKMRETAEALDYMTRAEDPVFWKLCDMNENRLEPEIQIMTENHALAGTKDLEWLNTKENLEASQRAMVGLNAMKENAKEDLAYAVETRDHQLYLETLERIEADAGDYAEILGNQSGEIWVERKTEHPAQFDGGAGVDFEEKKQLYLEDASRFANRYEQAIQFAESNSDEVMYLADDLLKYYRAQLGRAANYQGSFDHEFRHLETVAETMTSLLQEKQTNP